MSTKPPSPPPNSRPTAGSGCRGNGDALLHPSGRRPLNAREATPADRTAVIGLWERCALTRPWNDPVQDFDFACAGPASTVIVLEEADGIVGAAIVGYDGHRGSAYYVAVEPARQRGGAGRVLMKALEDWLRVRGVWKLNLLVRRENTAVIAFYETLGYGDQDCIPLGKRLDGQADRSVRQ